MIQSMWNILLSLAPWLLLGMAIAGLLHVALPRDFVRRHLGGRGGVGKAVLLGVPLPLCSCGVIPAGLGLKKDGASNGAAVGFLISTPQTGVDSILVSASFLGWPFALFKLASAAVTGLIGGWATNGLTTNEPLLDGPSEPLAVDDRRGLRDSLEHALDILRTIWRWIVFGVVVSAAIEYFLPQDFFSGLSGLGPFVPLLASLLISVPLYVCATASVPIAAALVASGMPTGAALVFLMAGPATNVATIGAIYRALGGRTLAVYLATIVGGSALAGLAFDSVLQTTATSAPVHIHETQTWWAVASAVVLLLLLGWFALEDLRAAARRLLSWRRVGGATVEIGVAGMNCGSCVSKLERALRESEGVNDVQVTLEPGKAVVRGSLGQAGVRRVIESLGFSVVDTTHPSTTKP